MVTVNVALSEITKKRKQDSGMTWKQLIDYALNLMDIERKLGMSMERYLQEAGENNAMLSPDKSVEK